MPEVRIVLTAESAAALARIKQFTQGIQQSFDSVKRGDPILSSSSIKVRELADATAAATRASNVWGQALATLPGPLGGIASQVTTLTTALRGPGGLVVGIGAVVAASALFVKSMADDIERLDNLSRQTGLAVSSLQAFEQAAKEAGESPDTLIQGLGRVNQAINDVLTGSSNAGKAFKAIGVDLRQLVRDGASTEDILEATAKALAAIPDPTRRAAAQIELFGNRGRAMSSVLDTIAKDGLGAYISTMEQAGIVTHDVTNKMARDFDLFFDRIFRGAFGKITQLKADLVDALTILKDVFEVGPIQAGRLARIRQNPPHEIVRPGILAPTPRTLAPTAEEKKAAEDAIKAALGNQNAMRLLNREWEEGARLGNQYAEILHKITLDKLDKEAQKAEASFKDYTVQLGETGRELLENNRVIDANVGEVQEQGEATGFAASMSAEFNRQLEGLPPSIMAVRDAMDQIVIIGREIEALDPERMAPGRDVERGWQAAAQAVQRFDTLADEMLRDLQSNLSEFLDDLLSGTLDVEQAIERMADTLQKSLADFVSSQVVKEFQAALNPAIDPATGHEISVREGGRGFVAEFATELVAAGGDLVTAFQNLSATSAQTAAALGQIAGKAVATGVFGNAGGQFGQIGSMVGGGAGAAVGGAFAGPMGAFAGGIWGNFVGQLAWGVIPEALGLIGGGEDPKWEKMRTEISQTLEAAASEGMARGLKHAVMTGDVAGGLDMFRESLQEAVFDALVNAMVEAVIVEGVLRPFIQAITSGIQEAVQAGFSPESMVQLRSRIDTLKGALASPEFADIWRLTVGALQGLGLDFGERTAGGQQNLAQMRQDSEQLKVNIQETHEAVATTADETAAMTAHLTAGTVPMQQLAAQYALLAQEHGPEFLLALEDSLIALGLSNAAASEILKTIELLAQGVEVPVVYTLTTQGTPPPGAGGPPIPAPLGDRGRLHGGWVGISGYAPGGWVTDGLEDRDSVLSMLARNEFVVNSRVTRLPGVGPFLEDLNTRGLAAFESRGGRRGGGDQDLVAALVGALQGMALQPDGPRTVQLLSRIAEALERLRVGRPAGARV
jgi:hypothetical protein